MVSVSSSSSDSSRIASSIIWSVGCLSPFPPPGGGLGGSPEGSPNPKCGIHPGGLKGVLLLFPLSSLLVASVVRPVGVCLGGERPPPSRFGVLIWASPPSPCSISLNILFSSRRRLASSSACSRMYCCNSKQLVYSWSYDPQQEHRGHPSKSINGDLSTLPLGDFSSSFTLVKIPDTILAFPFSLLLLN